MQYMEKRMHSDMIDLQKSALSLLKRFFGYDSFRPIQFDVIQEVMSGRDALVLMPTGGGKSICYQIPALLRDGCTIVISPLLALMKDQVDGLRANGIPAAAINSMQREATNREIIEKVHEGKVKLLYISPERLLSEVSMWSSTMNISMIAIDEAHCISQWGHDFRPEYTKLAVLKQYFPNVPFMALTATADKLTREDILRQMRMKDARLFISSFDRPNLSLAVDADATTGRQKLERIDEFLQHHPAQSGIIYCLARNTTESLAEDLRSMGYKAACYHAGLSTEERMLIQQQFLNDEIEIMCATIAFGMGIDKSNIRWVIHYNMPKNVECYYQEIGRAGRDGMAADTLMFYSYADVAMLTHFVEESGQMDINREKLQRMQEYAEAGICRRRMLLSYFNERYDHDCGNCDVCKNPPKRIDGTLLAQKAISAIARVDEKVGLNMLIDILRGSRKAAILERGYDKIKTFGVGADMPPMVWSRYILQMLQLGLLEIAYNEDNHLKITPYGWDVVRGSHRIEMSQVSLVRNTARTARPFRQSDMREWTFEEKLFAELKRVRLEIAKSEGVQAYNVLSDKVLSEVVKTTPVNFLEFAEISGIGEAKLLNYSKPFISVVRKMKGLPATQTGLSEDMTFYLINKGYDMLEIAEKRGLKLSTIASHVSKFIQFDKIKPNQYWAFIAPYDYEEIMNRYKQTGGKFNAVEVYGADAYKVTIAFAINRKRQQITQ